MMYRLSSVLLFLACVIPLSSAALPQDIDKVNVVIKTREKPRALRSLAPRGSQVARTRTNGVLNGVLFVLTDPLEATVIVRDNKGIARAQEAVADGEFRQELPPGSYEIEVSSRGYFPWKTKRPVVLRASASEIERADLRPTTGSIIIGPVDQGATIFLNEKKPATLGIRLEKREDQMELGNVPEGFYALRIEQPNFAPVSKDKVEVRGGADSFVTLRLEAATAEMTVATEPGTSVYVDNEFVGETTADGRLRRPSVKIGRHEVRLVKDGFEEFKQAYQFELGKPVTVERALVPRATSAEFGDDFGINLKKWAAPPTGWVRKAGRLEISNAAAIGTASGYNYRNFVMQFHLKLENGAGAAWAVRVKDPGNYYLFYLSGPQGLFPKRFNVYIVRDNKFDPQSPISSVPILQDLIAGSQYTVEISVLGNKIEHKITPVATGVAEPLGFFEDSGNLFPIGSVGFRTVATEVFSVDDVFVQPR
jgi:hypothetical protein